jgi:hypothetical protein
VRDYGFKTVGDCVRMMELYASCRQVRTPLRRLCLRVLEKLPLLRDRFFAMTASSTPGTGKGGRGK